MVARPEWLSCDHQGIGRLDCPTCDVRHQPEVREALRATRAYVEDMEARLGALEARGEAMEQDACRFEIEEIRIDRAVGDVVIVGRGALTTERTARARLGTARIVFGEVKRG